MSIGTIQCQRIKLELNQLCVGRGVSYLLFSLIFGPMNFDESIRIDIFSLNVLTSKGKDIKRAMYLRLYIIRFSVLGKVDTSYSLFAPATIRDQFMYSLVIAVKKRATRILIFQVTYTLIS